MMENIEESGEDKEMSPSREINLIKLAKQGWPQTLLSLMGQFHAPIYWLSIQIITWSSIIWPGEPLHFSELSYAYGLMFICGAIGRLFYGFIVDRTSRVKIFALCFIGLNLLFFCFGFIPSGKGNFSYAIFIILIVIREAFSGGGIVAASFIDDAIEESKRSQFYGVMYMLSQMLGVIAIISIPLLFAVYWRAYFWIVGGFGIVIGIFIIIKGKEPKRGAEKEELKSILKMDNMTYEYTLTREMLKKTVFSPTNLIMMIEGIFTQVVFAVPFMVVYAYLESSPFNLSPLSICLCGLIFGAPGGILGAIGFSKLSDNLAKKNLKNRIFVLFTSLIIFYIGAVVMFFIPIPHLTKAQGNNLAEILKHPGYWAIFLLSFLAATVMGVFGINQRPLLQKINLPEAQGAINSANSFLEVLGTGIGAILSGGLLALFKGSFQLTVIVICLIGAIGACMWLLCLKFLDKDMERLSGILKTRAREIEQKKNS
ncbi:MAG: MFS transporter [Candidatus Hodarchaeota archaeon]